MTRRSLKFFGGALVLLLSISFLVLASRSESDALRREMLLKVINIAINSGHYNPGNVDDGFSHKAFDMYLDRMDFSKRFLLKEDIERLMPYRNEIDNAFIDLDFTFFNLSVDILEKRTQEAQAYYREILSSPFDFTEDEWYEFDPEKMDFAKSKKELRERWRLSLKYETLSRVYEMQEDQDKAREKSDIDTLKTFDEMEVVAREKILKRYDDWFHRMSKLDETDRLNVYINSLVNVFDPHTEYYPPKDKDNFDIQFSGQLEGIGAQLTQRNAYIEVSKIIPGSPSWRQGELEVGDMILKVQQEGEEPVDVVDMRLDEAVLLIRGKKGTKVTLFIKKPDRTMKEITLVRDVVVLEETYVKSSVIVDPESGKKLGYIKLPSFYVDFTKMNGKNCYQDTRAELEKLKQENIQGLIFDLRDNGGGSLEDVVKIAGLFIAEGPVVQVRGKKNIGKSYEDLDPQIQYGGPLVVMVNMVSASASEIFAAAMQDYGRAIIMGGDHTYGKGTVQNFTELDRMIQKKPVDMQELGSLKMTVQKYYRINGKTTQLNGVIPDIILPDYYNYIDFGEKDMENPMPWDEIAPLSYTRWNTTYDMDYIIRLSKERIQQDATFHLIDENGRRLKQIRDNTTYSLNFDTFSQIADQRQKDAEKYDRIGKDTLGLSIKYLAADQPVIQSDTSATARMDNWIKTLKKDVYILEATRVLLDITGSKVANARIENN